MKYSCHTAHGAGLNHSCTYCHKGCNGLSLEGAIKRNAEPLVTIVPVCLCFVCVAVTDGHHDGEACSSWIQCVQTHNCTILVTEERKEKKGSGAELEACECDDDW